MIAHESEQSMSNLAQVVTTKTRTNTAISGATEVVAATVSGLNVPTDNAQVFLMGWVALTPPGSTTSIRAQIQRGTAAAGTAVGDTGLTTNGPAASAIGWVNVAGQDTMTDIAQGAYVLTLICTAGSGAGTINAVGLAAFVYN